MGANEHASMSMTHSTSPSSTLWCELSSLVRHRGFMSGIQRAVSGLATGLLETQGARPLRFCAFDRRTGFRALGDRDVEELLATFDASGARKQDQEPGPWKRLGSRIGRARLRAPFAPGDLLFNPGFTTWKSKQYEEVASLLAGVSYVGFIYDLLPVAFPEWWTPSQQDRYRGWFEWSGRNAASLLCCSDSTRRDAVAFFDAARIETGPIETLLLGDELPRALATRRAAAESAAAERPFVLYVSTLEVRKNHRLLFQVWRRLLERHGRDAVPDLVFVGRRGWLIDDFVTELEQSRFLDGKISWRQRVDDAELARLYASCLFTVYPSFYEGWGLPVAEGMAFGRWCLASDRSSLPEVGRDLAGYFDPGDVPGATAAIERAISDPAYLAEKTRAVRERFTPRSWRTSAVELRARLEALADQAGKSSAR